MGPQSPPLPPPPSPWPRRWAGGPGQGLPTAPRRGTRGSEHGALPPRPAAIRPAGLCGHEPGSSWAGPRGEAVSLSPAGCLQPPPGSATRARPCGRRRRPGGAGCSVDWLCGLAVPRRLPLQSPGMELQPRPAPARWRCLPAQRLRQDRVGWAAGSGPRSPTGRGGGQGSLHGDRGVRREGRYKEEGGSKVKPGTHRARSERRGTGPAQGPRWLRTAWTQERARLGLWKGGGPTERPGGELS